MFDDQTTSRWIPRNQLGLPVYGQSQAIPPAEQLQSFDATPAVAFELGGWDDEDVVARVPQAQLLARQNTQPALWQARAAIAPQAVASPPVSSALDLASDIARIRARPPLPLWLRVLVPGVGVFAAVLFGVVIVFVEPSSARPAAQVPAPAPVPVLAEAADANPAPVHVTTPPAEAQPSATARPEAASAPATKHDAPTAKARHTQSSTPARDVSGEPAPAAVGGGRLGMLRLNSRPWSQVSIDGRPIGHTPIMGVPLKAGEHRVELVNEALDVHKTIQVKIKPDEVVTKIVLLVD